MEKNKKPPNTQALPPKDLCFSILPEKITYAYTFIYLPK